MKAIILAGGSGDRLFPLSRRNYPKQFIHINEDRSIFQETITRNMPFCDEFIIVTNEKYENAIEAQLQTFQGLHYRQVLEKEANGTAPAILLALKGIEEDEMVLILPSDLTLETDSYSDAIYEGKNLAQDGRICLFGVKPKEPSTSYGYIRIAGSRAIYFTEKPSKEEAEQLYLQEDVLWNTGMVLAKASTLLQEYEEFAEETYLSIMENQGLVQMASFERLILEKTGILSAVSLDGHFHDLSDLRTYSDEVKQENHLVIQRGCDNTHVINDTVDQLVVVNDIEDAVIVNTRDAIYISSRESVDNIRDIIEEEIDHFPAHFTESPKVYRPWGTREIIRKEPGFQVRKIIVYPGMKISKHFHERKNEDYSVVSGCLTVELPEETFDVMPGESVNIVPGLMHQLRNNTDEELVMIEVDTGEVIEEGDMVHGDRFLPSIYKLHPAYKDYLWGGTRLKEKYGKDSTYDITAESWELSAHPDGQSQIVGGQFDGMPFGDFISEYGSLVSGWKAETFDRFPILIKFIDAKNPLSIQIHPNDDYAFVNENEFGKNEMWYIMDCEKDSYLYCGLKEEVDKQELRDRIQNHTITDVLNKVYVKPGDVIFVPAGTIHAIGAGILICEIQQNSNSTYRMYDYGRVDKNGKERPLHVDKAMDVVNLRPFTPVVTGFSAPITYDRSTQQILSSCKYFETRLYHIPEHEMIQMDESSFKSILVLKGHCQIRCGDEVYEARELDSFFISAGRKRIHVTGDCELIVTNV